MVNYRKGQVWNKAKTADMKKFEKEEKKNAVYKGKVTGQFIFWLYQQEINCIRNIAKKYSNKTKTFEKEWWKSDTGYCTIAAYNLSKYLNKIGYKSLVIYGSYKWLDDHYWVSVIINDNEIWIDPTYYQFRYNKDLGGGILIGLPKEFLTTGYKKSYITTSEGMTKFRSNLFYCYSGGKNNPKYKV